MSQTATLRALDAELMTAMLDAGFADAAMYTPPAGGVGIACKVMVDRDVSYYGQDEAEVAGLRTLVTLFLAEVVNPQRLATITVGSEIFKLEEVDARDESMSRWVVVSG